MAAAQPTERLTLILVQRQYAHDKTALELRKEDIAAYSKVMDDIAKLHAKLKQDATKKISMVEIDKQVGPIIRSIINALSDIQSRSNKS
jgi:hypothetical protein